MCPYEKLACSDCHINKDDYFACARYKYATVKGALAIPHNMGVLDYAKIPQLLREGK